MSEDHQCPKCSAALGFVGGRYCCWNASCDFLSYRPWISTPEKKEDFDMSKELESIIGECLHAAANGPFFVDYDAKDNPCWEFPALLGFSQPEVKEISEQWPNVDIGDEFISEFISSCFAHLLGYPHRCEKYWPEYFSVSLRQLNEYADAWRHSKYV